VTQGGSGHAYTIHHCPTRTAAEGDLRDNGVRLSIRRGCYCFPDVATPKIKEAIAVNLIIFLPSFM
jgi:hypothetical protein